MAQENGKPEEKRGKSKGFLAQKYKPGQSGNPSGLRKHRGFVDYLSEFFDEEVTVQLPGFGNDGSKTKKIKREEYFARMIGQAALTSQDSALRRDCIKIVIDGLWPPSKTPLAFIQINQEIHTQAATHFIDALDVKAGGGKITPNMLLAALKENASGEAESPNGRGNGKAN